MEVSVNGKKKFLQNFGHHFFCIATVKVLQFLTFISDHFAEQFFFQIPSLNRYEKVQCENCGTQTTKLKLARHKKSCSAGTLQCTQCPNFFTKSQNDLTYHIAKGHSVPKPDVIFKCKLCYQKFPRFYAFRQHKNTQLGAKIGFQASNIDVEDIVGDVDDQSLREELKSCKHFLTDIEMENQRH